MEQRFAGRKLLVRSHGLRGILPERLGDEAYLRRTPADLNGLLVPTRRGAAHRREAERSIQRWGQWPKGIGGLQVGCSRVIDRHICLTQFVERWMVLPHEAAGRIQRLRVSGGPVRYEEKAVRVRRLWGGTDVVLSGRKPEQAVFPAIVGLIGLHRDQGTSSLSV